MAATGSGQSSETLSSNSSNNNGSGTNAGAIFLNPYCTVSIKAHVPVELDLASSNFSKWSTLFMTMLGKFGLLSHIDPDVPARHEDAAWQQADHSVQSWLYGSVSSEILDTAMNPDQMACLLYTAIKDQFPDNQEARAVFFNNQFHSLVQGDLPMSEYCNRAKTIADSLHDVGSPVSDSQLVLAGLNPCFSSMADDITNSPPFSTFAKAHSMLCLKELRLANDLKVVSNTALVASSSSFRSSDCRFSSTSAPSTNNSESSRSNNDRGRGRDRGRGHGGGCSGGSG